MTEGYLGAKLSLRLATISAEGHATHQIFRHLRALVPAGHADDCERLLSASAAVAREGLLCNARNFGNNTSASKLLRSSAAGNSAPFK